MSTNTPSTIVNLPKTLVFYFEHNLDAALSAKAIQALMQRKSQGSAMQLIAMTPACPDASIMSHCKVSGDVGAICVLGYCPEDLITLDLVDMFPKATVTYFVYENNIQFGSKLSKILAKRDLSKSVKVCKPSTLKSSIEDLPCPDSISAMLQTILVTEPGENFGRGCRTAMSAVSRWMTREETSMQDLNIAWAIRYDPIATGFAGSEMDMYDEVGETPSEIVTFRVRNLCEAIYTTMATRKVTIPEVKRMFDSYLIFRTVMVSPEYNHDVYRRLILVWENFIIVNRVVDLSHADGFLISVAVSDPGRRSAVMQQLGVSKFWMEGSMAVGFSVVNPLH
jgi:hypothetical protein